VLHENSLKLMLKFLNTVLDEVFLFLSDLIPNLLDTVLLQCLL